MMWQAKRSGDVATVDRSVKIVKKDVDDDDGGGKQPAEKEADESSDDGDN